MGLALDEPRDGDETYKVDDLDVILDPFAMKVVKESGGANIKNSHFGPIVELKSAEGGCDCGDGTC